jgi:hypothetical protein
LDKENLFTYYKFLIVLYIYFNYFVEYILQN